MNVKMPVLFSYSTGEFIRTATIDELHASIEAGEKDGGVGAINVDGTTCYVDIFTPDFDHESAMQ